MTTNFTLAELKTALKNWQDAYAKATTFEEREDCADSIHGLSVRITRWENPGMDVRTAKRLALFGH